MRRLLRILVPNEDLTVASFEPRKRIYQTERYLLDLETMESMREMRAGLDAPLCNSGEEAAAALGDQQARLIALLPEQPNERLVCRCNQAP